MSVAANRTPREGTRPTTEITCTVGPVPPPGATLHRQLVDARQRLRLPQFFVSSCSASTKMLAQVPALGPVGATENDYGKIIDASCRRPPRQTRGAADGTPDAENHRAEPGEGPFPRSRCLRHGPRDLHVCLRLAPGRV